MPTRNYIIYCDESDKKGDRFSNFFGGVLVNSKDQQRVEALLQKKKDELHLTGEVKWQKVSSQYLDKYIQFADYYLDFVASGRLRIRIMFSDNHLQPIGLSAEQRQQAYFLMYYQFLKHAFGIRYCNPDGLDIVRFSVFPDQIPDSKEKVDEFRRFLSRIPNTRILRGLNIEIPMDQIIDVDSRKHNILQGLDVLLGAMNSKLNKKLEAKPEGARTRGKRTIAKEKLYKHINRRVRDIYPHFNIGITTGQPNGPRDRWTQPYRHWLFRPKNARYIR